MSRCRCLGGGRWCHRRCGNRVRLRRGRSLGHLGLRGRVCRPLGHQGDSGSSGQWWGKGAAVACRVPSSGRHSGSHTELGPRRWRRSAQSLGRTHNPLGRARCRSQVVASALHKWLSNQEHTAHSGSVWGTAGLREQGMEDYFKAGMCCWESHASPPPAPSLWGSDGASGALQG